ncbi:uncharacterized protein DS421_3g98710 [Arachis hypogaea]|nr:uncharacterized protein DS421_3g98710 [Arachis hypogaea]
MKDRHKQSRLVQVAAEEETTFHQKPVAVTEEEGGEELDGPATAIFATLGRGCLAKQQLPIHAKEKLRARIGGVVVEECTGTDGDVEHLTGWRRGGASGRRRRSC